MKKVDEKTRIDQLAKDLKEAHGPLMRRQDIQSLLHFAAINSVDRWLAEHGLTTRRAGPGLYFADDVARAVVLGCV